MAKAGKLPFPVMAVNDARVKHLFDNRYGTGESSVYSFMHNTNLLIGGKTFVVAGFGFVAEALLRNSGVWVRRSLSLRWIQ